MECPNCKTEMKSGFARIHGTFFGFLLLGLSYQHIFFKPEDGGPEKKIMECERKKQAFYCEKCETMIVSGPPQKDVWGLFGLGLSWGIKKK